MLSRDAVAEYLDYDPETGEFRWKKRPSRGVAIEDSPGCITRTRTRDGSIPRRVINLFGKRHPAASLAWLLMTGEWPLVVVDHRDRDGLNNRWTNLRLATKSQNQWNKGPMKNNTSGYKGVSPTKEGRWLAQINRRYVGLFDTAEEAARAYDQAVIAVHGEFAYLNFGRPKSF
jgi:hypothetical protein